MDHDIFEHLGTSHIVRQGKGSVYFFFWGGEVLGGTEGGWVVANRISRGDYRKLTASEGGGVNFVVTQPNSPLPLTPQTPDDEQWPVPKRQLFCSCLSDSATNRNDQL